MKKKVASAKLELIASVREQLNEVNCGIDLSDADLMRFLRARNGNVKKSVEMIVNWKSWRDTPICSGYSETPNNILEKLDENEAVYRKMTPHSNLGHDKEGRPLYFEETGLISGRMVDLLKEVNAEQMTIRHVRQQEFMMRRMKLASIQFGKPIEKQVIVFDLKGLNYSLNTTALSIFKKTIQIDQAYYPETLQCFFMVNAPWFFTSIFGLIKPMLDPITAEKFKILGTNYLETLLEYMDIDQIPVEMGGTNDSFAWTYPENFNYHSEMNELNLAIIRGEGSPTNLPVPISLSNSTSKLETSTSSSSSSSSSSSLTALDSSSITSSSSSSSPEPTFSSEKLKPTNTISKKKIIIQQQQQTNVSSSIPSSLYSNKAKSGSTTTPTLPLPPTITTTPLDYPQQQLRDMKESSSVPPSPYPSPSLLTATSSVPSTKKKRLPLIRSASISLPSRNNPSQSSTSSSTSSSLPLSTLDSISRVSHQHHHQQQQQDPNQYQGHSFEDQSSEIDEENDPIKEEEEEEEEEEDMFQQVFRTELRTGSLGHRSISILMKNQPSSSPSSSSSSFLSTSKYSSFFFRRFVVILIGMLLIILFHVLDTNLILVFTVHQQKQFILLIIICYFVISTLRNDCPLLMEEWRRTVFSIGWKTFF